jgi:hypothetical protein
MLKGQAEAADRAPNFDTLSTNPEM